jgi:hypothetical protein
LEQRLAAELLREAANLPQRTLVRLTQALGNVCNEV